MSAREVGSRPSQLVDIHDPYVAYCFDQAVLHVGGTITNELESVKGKNDREIERKREAVLVKYLGEAARAKKKFREPMR